MSSPIERVYAELLDREYQQDVFHGLEGFQRKGTGYIARCPFHEDALPTMVIYGDRPEYFCFACDRRGDWIHYLMEKQCKTFHEALDILVRASGHECSGYTEEIWKNELATTLLLEASMSSYMAGLWSPSGEYVLHYLYKRGYATGEVKGMAVGYFPGHDESLQNLLVDQVREPGLAIPYRDASGRLMGLIYKDVRVQGTESYSPLTSLEKLRDIPFLFYRSRGQHDIIVVEGIFDALLLDQLRLKPVMGIGKMGLSRGMLHTAEEFGCRHLILCLGNSDRQNTDIAAAIRLISGHGLAVSVLPVPTQYADIDEFIRMTCLDHYKALLKKAVPGDKWQKDIH